MIRTATRRIRWSAVLAATTIVFSVFSSVPGAAAAAAVVPVAEAIPVVPAELVADGVDVGRSVMQVAAAGTATSGAVAPYGSAVGVSRTDTRGRWVSAGSDSLGIAIAEPRIGLAKDATVVNNGDGTYELTYLYVVENLGNVPLTDIFIADWVIEPFRVVRDLTPMSGSLVVNPSWRGSMSSNILAPHQVLEVGRSGTVSVRLTVEPGSRAGPYRSESRAYGTFGDSVLDVATDGPDPDPDGDGDATNNSKRTVVWFDEDGAVSVVKALGSVVEGGEGVHEVTFEYVVSNSGDVNVNELRLVDDVSSQFRGAGVSGFVATVTDGGDVVTVSEGWDGTAGSNMFSDGQSLLRGTSVTVRGSFMVTPGASLEYPGGLATVSGSTPSGARVEDMSDGVLVAFDPRPVIGVAKEATVVNNGDGTYQVTFGYVVENLGNVRLVDLTLSDNVVGTFGTTATGFTAGTVTREGYEALNGNEGWNGTSNVLVPGQVLEPGESGVVSVSFTVTPTSPHEVPLTYDTTAEVTGTHESMTVDDDSTDGTVPDPDGDGDPTNNGDVTVVTFNEGGAIGVTKALGSVVEGGEGVHEVTFEYVVSNSGDVNVNELRLVDDVSSQFRGAGVSGFVATVTEGGDVVTVSEGWDGTAGSNMFSDGQSLLRGTSVTVRGSFMVTPGASLEYPGGLATVSGSTPSGARVEDMSDGVLVAFDPRPVIGVAKEATVVNNGDGTYQVTFGYVVENLGNVRLVDLTLSDNVVGTFGTTATGFTAGTVTREGYEALNGNEGWNGTSNVLVPGQVLEPGESGVVSVSFTVTPTSPHEVPLTYDTTAEVTGTHESMTVDDDSTDGTVPDPDGDGDPTNNGDVTVVTFNEGGAIGVTKALGSVVEGGEGVHEVTFEYVVSNSGDVNVNELRLVDDVSSQFRGAGVSGFVATVTDGGDVVTVSEGWDGTAGSNMFSDGQSLLRGTSVTVRGSFMVTPGASLEYPGGLATVSGSTPSGARVEDMSDGVLVAFDPRPVIGVAKEATVVNNGDGTYQVTFGYVVENSGSVRLVDLTLSDNVVGTFGTTATGFTAGTVTREGYEALNGNEGWNGTSNVLVPGQVLEPGESGVVSVSFTVTPTSPHEVPLTYDTTAEVTGTHESMTVDDDSTDGTVPDPDGDGDPTNNGDVTVVTFNEGGAIGVTKALGSVVEGGEGVHEVTFEYVVSNSGDVNVNELRLVDDVSSQFRGAGVSGFVATVTDGGDVVTVSEGWDGTAGSNMFSDGQSLLRGTSVTVRGSFMVTPGASLEYPGGLATVSGSTPSGARVEDMSDGVLVAFDPRPVIGVAKEATVVNNGDGTYQVTFGYVVENSGSVRLVDLTLSDNVVGTFGTTATGFTAGTVTREGYEALNGNEGWNGTSNVLVPGQVLEPGESGVVSVSFTVTPTSPHEVPLTYDTTAEVTGTHESMTVDDDSTDGTVPDPDGDGDPTNNGDVTVVTFNEGGAVSVVKALGSVVEGGEGVHEVTFEYVVSNSGDVNVNELRLVDDVSSQFRGAGVSGFVATVTDGGDVVTVSEGWDGTAGSNMFSDGQSLLRGTSVTVRGSFMVTPGASLEYPGGLATVSGSTPSGARVEDMSDGVLVAFDPRPVIGVAKEATVVNNGDGTYQVTFGYVVENLGNVPLENLVLVDNVVGGFGDGVVAGLTVVTDSQSVNGLMGNPVWDGTGSNILAVGQVLEPGESGVVSVSLIVTPGVGLGSHEIEGAEVSGTYGSARASQVASSTVVTFTEDGAVSVVKALGSVVEGGEGVHEVTFEYVVSNSGDVNVNELRLVDDVSSQFRGAGVSGFVATVTDGTDLVTVNEGWDGTAGSNMFSDGQSLLRGTSVTVRGSFMVTPGASLEYPGGLATVSGSTPSGARVEDMSDGVLVAFDPRPVIGVAKEATVVNNGDGTYQVTFGYVVENLGNVPLENLVLVDNVVGGFGDGVVAGLTVVTDSQSVNGLMGNPVWDGTGSNILAVGQVLEPGESGVVSVSLIVTPGVGLGSHEIEGAEVSGTYGSARASQVASSTVVTFNEGGAIGVVKALGSVVEGGEGVHEVTFEYVVSNSGDVNVNELRLVDDVSSQFRGAGVSGFVATVTDGGDVVTVSEGWDGTAGSNMFSDGQSLLRGTSVTVRGSFMVTPGASLEYPGGLATVSGSTPSGARVEDMSDGVLVAFDPRPVIGVAKEATVVNNGDGTYQVTFGYVVENLGSVRLVDLTLSDNVVGTFGTTATGFTAGTVTREGYEALNGNEGWDGTGSNVLVPGQVLEPGESGVVSVSFTVTPTSPHEVPLTYDTTAEVTGTHESMTVDDDSTDGTVPDPDGDGDPTNNGDVTVVTFNEGGAIGVTKALGSVVEGGEGVHEVTFEYVVSNSGDVNVNELRLVDDVSSQFRGAGVSGFVATVTDGGDVVTVSEGWDGTAGSNMFSDGQSLLRGTSVTVRGSFMVTPGASLEYPGGLATVSGSTPSGARVEDMSDGVLVAFDPRPVIGVAKEATVVNNGDGTYQVTFGYVVENSGSVRLVDLTLSDNVVGTFGTTATGFTAGTVTREGYEALNGNEGWNGTSNVLVPGQVLEPGESGVVSVSFTVTPTSPHEVPLTYDTTAEVTGTHESMTVDDDSTDGTVPDPDGDGDPTNNGDVTVVTFNEGGAIGVTKALGSVVEGGEGVHEVTFEYVVSNSGDVNVNELHLVDDVSSQFRGAGVSGFVATVTDGGDVVTVSEGWDGTAGSNMFSDGQSLLRGTSVTVRGSFMVTPGASLEYPGGLATVSGSTPSGARVEDMSDGVLVAFDPRPVIGVAKEATVVNNGDGTYQVTFGYVVENSGSVRLVDLTLSDNVVGTFGTTATGFTAGTVTREGYEALNGNEGWNGTSNVLVPGQVLEPGESGVVSVSFTVTPTSPHEVPLTYDTTAEVTGTHESMTVDDDSTDGTVPDPDGDGDPTNNGDVTVVTFNEGGAIGVTKALGSVVEGGEGVHEVTFEYVVSNSGDVNVNELRLVDDVSSQFRGAGVSGFVATVTDGGDVVTVSEGWDGTAGSNMFSDGQSLLRGTSVTVRGSFMVTPGASLEYPGGLATVSGSTPSGARVEDMSDGVLVAFDPRPVIGVAKEATVVNNGDGTYQVTFGYVVENSGNVRLVDLTLSDNVVGTFGTTATGFTAGTVTREGYEALNGNEGWNGTSNVLVPGQVLEPGESGVVSVSFTVTPTSPHEVPLTYDTTAEVTGTHESMTVDDDSTDGTVPDPDGDGDPTNNGDVTVVTFNEGGAIGVTKALGSVVEGGEGVHEVTFEYVVSNSGDVNVNELRLVDDVSSQFRGAGVSGFVATVTDGGDVVTVSEGWDGTAGSNMFSDGQSLLRGTSVTVRGSFMVTPGASLEYPGGLATVSGSTPSGARVEDMSDGVLVAFDPRPVIGVAKEATVVNNGDGTYQVTFGYVVENLGNVRLVDLTLSDNVVGTFGTTATGFTAGTVTREGYEALNGNEGWNGTSNVLVPGQVLEPGESGVVSVSFTVTPTSPHEVPLTYDTTAEVTGTHESMTVDDDSTDGTVPDPDGDGDPTNNGDVTVVTFNEGGAIGVTKALGSVVEGGEGVHEVTFEYVVSNSGDVNVNELRLVDDVSSQFRGAGVSGFVATVTDGGDVVTVSEGWDGTAGSNMFSDGQSLLRGTSVTVRGSFMVTPGASLEYPGGLATVSGSTPSGARVEDMSDGVLVAFDPRPVIGVAKEATVVNNGDGTYQVTFGYVVENLGNVRLVDLTLSDNVVGTFGTTATGFTAGTVTREGYEALNGNEGWNGTSNVLVPGQVLEPGESGVVSVSFTVTPTSPHEVPLTYDTTAEVTGTHESMTVDDDSTDGTVPDPDGDGDPTNNGDVTVVTFNEGGAIGVTKALGSVVEGGEGVHEVTFEYVVSNSGDVNVNELRLVDDVSSQFRGAGVSGFVATVTEGGDVVTVSEGWDGTAGSNMFSDGQSLLRGTSVTVRGSFMVTPGASLEYPGGLATVSGSTPSGARVEDMSDGVLVAFDPRPVIGVAKEATVVNNGDGTYQVTFGYVVENSGSVRLVDLTLSDNVVGTFGTTATGFTAGTVTREGYEALNGNEGWNGTSNVLVPGQVLEPGESGVVSVSFTVTPTSPHEVPLTYDTTAEVTGTHESMTVDDDSTDGTVPDPDGDGDPTNNGDVTVVTFNEDGAVSVVKALGSVVEGGEGVHEVTFEYVVSNSGDVNVNELRLVDDVSSQFRGAGVSGFVATVTDGGDVVTVSEGWDGTAGSNMFSDGQSLLRGTSVTVRGSFMVTPGASLEYPGGLATVSGSTPSGAPVESVSDGVLVALEPPDLRRAVIGLAQEAAIINNGDGTYEVTYEFVVENLGNVPLENLVLVDNVFETFGTTATGFAVGTVTREGYEALNGNEGWDGTGSNILAVGQVLEPGESGVVSVSFTVTPGIGLSPGESAAEATGDWVGGLVSDGATDGTIPDSDGDGDPTNNGDVTVVTFNEGGAIGVTKALGSVGESGEGAYEVTFEYVVSNSGDVNVNELRLVDDVSSQFPGAEVSGFVATVTDGGDVVTVSEGWDGTAGSNMFSDGQSLLRGTSVTVQGSFMVTPGTSLEYPGGLATVSGSTPSGAPVEDMSDSVGVSFESVESFDLELVVTDSGDAYSGGTLSYVFSTTNLGPGVAYGPLVLVVDVPVGLSIVSASGSNDSCVIEGQVVTCTRVGDLGVGASSDVTVLTTVVAADGVSLAVSGSVMSQGGAAEGSVTNNADTATRVVGALPTTGFVFSWLWLLGALVMVVGSGVVWSANRRREDALL